MKKLTLFLAVYAISTLVWGHSHVQCSALDELEELSQAQSPTESDGNKGNMQGEVVITAPGNRARLCPEPNCSEGEELIFIPTGTKIPFKSKVTVPRPMPYWSVLWYEVEYKGKRGWVSELDTNYGPKTPPAIGPR